MWRSPAFSPLSHASGEKAGEESGGLCRASAQLRQADDESEGGHGTDAGDGEQDVEAALEGGIGAEAAFDLGVEAFDVPSQNLQPPAEFGLEKGGLTGAALVGQRGLVGFGRRARPRQFLQRLDRFGRRGDRAGLEGLAHERQHARVEPIGLGELTDRLGEQTRPQRIDDGDREACCMQGAMRLPVEFAGRLHDDHLDRQFHDATLEGFQALGRVRHAERLANGVEIGVEPIFTNVDADVDSLCASFGRFLTLHAGLAPNHLFRTSAKDGRTQLIHGPGQGAYGPARPTLGGWPSPERQLEILSDSCQSEHARGWRPEQKLPHPEEPA